ncbi:hypothetical protein [Pseudonocardia sp. ICBG601]|uniref:hypothetical protein n=1 Tax=Pseudonocardia sp. ICBG601 TaxID=2846759 RepID=UPI0021F50C5C
MSENGSGEQPDGSVGRYVRERWATTESPGRSFGRRRRTGGDDAAEPAAEPGDTPPRTPTAAERAASAPAPGRAAIGTQTPPAGSAWGSELPEIDDDLVDEIDPSTPPHGMDLSALRETPRPTTPAGTAAAADAEEEEPAQASAGDPRHRRDDASPDPGVHDHGPDDTGLYRAGGTDSEPWWAVPASAVPDDDPDADLIWRADRSGGARPPAPATAPRRPGTTPRRPRPTPRSAPRRPTRTPRTAPRLLQPTPGTAPRSLHTTPRTAPRPPGTTDRSCPPPWRTRIPRVGPTLVRRVRRPRIPRVRGPRTPRRAVAARRGAGISRTPSRPHPDVVPRLPPRGHGSPPEPPRRPPPGPGPHGRIVPVTTGPVTTGPATTAAPVRRTVPGARRGTTSPRRPDPSAP